MSHTLPFPLALWKAFALWSFLMTPLACAQGAQVVVSPPTIHSSAFYTANRSPLQGSPFLKLPPGAVKPRGWIRRQLEMDAAGIIGHMPEISNFVNFETSGWVHPGMQNGWEEVAYWLRGYGDLGYVLNDATIIASSQKWMDGMLRNQSADGYFGPERLRTSLDGKSDLWPHMLMLDALQSYYEFSGDRRVVPFMLRYFKWQASVPVETFKIGGWRTSRWADNTNLIYWLYNCTGESFLLHLAKKIHNNSDNFVDNLPTAHNVNLAQGIREPGQYWMQSGDPKHLGAVENNYQMLRSKYGQFPGGGFAGDENVRPNFTDPRQGFETCGFVEFMRTHEMMTRISGNPIWADRAEDIAFNSLPAALTPDHKGIHYITSANMVRLDRGETTGQFDNRWSMLEYEPAANTYRCCPHNYAMAWPYYTEESWLATGDKGVAASLYIPSEATVKVADGTLITWTETTDYPFRDTIEFKLSTPKTLQFPFYLRIPSWAKGAEVSVNNRKVKMPLQPHSYVLLERSWKNGDTVRLRLPMQVSLHHWKENKNSVSVNYGPLAFAFSPGEKWVKTAGTDQWPNMSVYPEKAWNYGFPESVSMADFKVVRKPGTISDQPFTLQTVPLTLTARARRIPGWQTDRRGIVRTLQASPALSTEPLETIALVPMAAARLRIASFPTVSTAPTALDWRKGLPRDFAATASHVSDNMEALYDGVVPSSSGDYESPRFTWWNHTGTTEWAALALKTPQRVSSVALYWFDDSGRGQCRVPASWQLLYLEGSQWKPVKNATAFGIERDRFNFVSFTPITTTGLKVEVQLKPGFSGGILEWRVEDK